MPTTYAELKRIHDELKANGEIGRLARRDLDHLCSEAKAIRARLEDIYAIAARAVELQLRSVSPEQVSKRSVSPKRRR